MKALKVLAVLALVASLALNVWLWQQRAAQLADLEAARSSAAAAEVLRAENEALKAKNTEKPTATDTDKRELARLRNEVGQLRKQTSDTESLRVQAAEAGQLRTQLAIAKKNLASTEDQLAEAAKLTPEEHLALKGEAQAISCINNLKQIGLAARLYAKDHEGAFPPDLVTMADKLTTPRILFCPAAPDVVPVTEWAQLNPATISYQFLNPNGSDKDGQKPLTTCPIHGHFGYSDGSVYKGKK
jgi:hypothetical protein